MSWDCEAVGFVRITRIGRTSIAYEYEAIRLPDEELMVTGTQTLVLIDRERRPISVPDAARIPISSFEGEGLTA